MGGTALRGLRNLYWGTVLPIIMNGKLTRKKGGLRELKCYAISNRSPRKLMFDDGLIATRDIQCVMFIF